MEILAQLVGLAFAFVLLWAGLDKMLSLGYLTETLIQIGVPRRGARSTAVALATLEIVVAIGLMIAPGSAAAVGGLLLLAGAFVLAALVALLKNEAIDCACFGFGGQSYLGYRQLAAAPLWLAGALLLWQSAPAMLSRSEGVLSFVFVAFAIATVRGVTVLQVTRLARDDRESAREMLTWL